MGARDEGGAIEIPAPVTRYDRDPIPAVVDLGAQRSVVNPRARGGAPTVAHAKAAGIAGEAIDADLCAFRSLALGEVTQQAPQLVVSDLPPVFAAFGLADRPGMILGLDVLSRFVVTIDYELRTVWVGPRPS